MNRKLLLLLFSNFLLIIITFTHVTPVKAGIDRIWAIDDGEKVKKGDLNHPLAFSSSNLVWDGNSISIFGARNEIVAFQLIIQSNSSNTNNVNVTLDQLTNGSYTIKNTGSSDPFDYVGKHIELFTEHYLNIHDRTATNWHWWPNARAMDIHGNEYLGWVPDALIPFEAPSGLGGAPFDIAPNSNQGVWVDVYIPRDADPGSYQGEVKVYVNSDLVDNIPIDLVVYDFTLPDETHLKNFFYGTRSGIVAKHGVTDRSQAYYEIEGKYHQMAHRHRLDLSYNGDLDFIKNHYSRYLTGRYYTNAYNYEGPGKGVGHGTYSIGTYDQPGGYTSGFTGSRDIWWQQSDAWVNWFQQNAPNTEIFVYMRDEPFFSGSSAIEDVKTKSQWLHTNPGPGRELMSFCTTGGVEGRIRAELEGYVDFWQTTGQSGYEQDGGVSGFVINSAKELQAIGNKVGIYNGTRPSFGTVIIDTDAIDFRINPWISWKHNVNQYFLWHVNYFYQDSRRINPFVDNYRVYSGRVTNGDGTLFYPGEDKEFPQDDRKLSGPISSIRMKNWRRGAQDYEYFLLAKQQGFNSQLNSVIYAVVPKAFDETTQNSPAPWATRGYQFENHRQQLANLISRSALSPTPTPTLILGDGNNDGFVDIEDYAIWIINFLRSTNPVGSSQGDFNSDGKVDGRDYTIWLNNYSKLPTEGGILQFKSGFEDNTRIGGSGGLAGRKIEGIDNSSPDDINSWDKLFSGDYLPWVVQAYGYLQGGALKIAQDPTDPNNKVLHLHNTELDVEEQRLSRSQWTMMQAQWWVDDGTPNQFDKQFYRYRMFIPDNIPSTYTYGDWSRWYMIWESHSWPEETVGEKTRYGVYIKKDTNSDHWYFRAIQQRPEGCSDPGQGPCEAYWENTDNQNIAVPFGKWFTFEVFFKYHESDGEFYVAITEDGKPRQVVAHYEGQTKFDQKLHDQMVFKMYHHRDYLDKLGETSQYYDDFEIWSDYPPGY
jgi:hypothetical protein